MRFSLGEVKPALPVPDGSILTFPFPPLSHPLPSMPACQSWPLLNPASALQVHFRATPVATPCLPIPLRCFPQRFPSTPRPSCPSIPSSGALQFTPVRSMPALSFHSQPHRMEPMPSMATRAVPAAPVRADPCRSRCFPSCSAPLLSDAAVPCHSQPLLVPPRLPVPAGPYPIPPIQTLPWPSGPFQVLSKSLPRPIRCLSCQSLAACPRRFVPIPSATHPGRTIPAHPRLSHPPQSPPVPSSPRPHRALPANPFHFTPVLSDSLPRLPCRIRSNHVGPIRSSSCPLPSMPAVPHPAHPRLSCPILSTPPLPIHAAPAPEPSLPCPLHARSLQSLTLRRLSFSEPLLPAFPLPRQVQSTPIHSFRSCRPMPLSSLFPSLDFNFGLNNVGQSYFQEFAQG